MRLAVAVLLLLAGACDEAPERPAQEVAVQAASADGAIAAPHPHRNFLLAAGGFQVLDMNGEPKRLAFGASRAAAEQAAAGVFGTAEARRSNNAECGAGPMEFTSWGPLTLNFRDDLFVGWTAEHPADVPTIDGASSGMSRAELEQAREVRLVEDSTLGEEFTFTSQDGGTIGGIFEGEGADSRVALLYAGTTCFFR